MPVMLFLVRDVGDNLADVAGVDSGTAPRCGWWVGSIPGSPGVDPLLMSATPIGVSGIELSSREVLPKGSSSMTWACA